jgi:hypothetical protein
MANIIVRKDGVDPYPEVRLYGEIFLSIIQSMNYYDFQPLVDEWLVQSGIRKIDPNAWYPRQEWLNLVKKLETQTNSIDNQVSIGIKVIENAVLPPGFQINSVQDAIMMLRAVYLANQQNLPPGENGYEIKQIDARHFEILDTSPYPVYVNYGYVFGVLKRFMPVRFSLEFDYLNPSNPLMGGLLFKIALEA